MSTGRLCSREGCRSYARAINYRGDGFCDVHAPNEKLHWLPPAHLSSHPTPKMVGGWTAHRRERKRSKRARAK